MQTSSLKAIETSADVSIVASPLVPVGSAEPENPDATPVKDEKKKKKTKHKVRIEHQTRGRVRMKVSSAKGDAEELREIGKTFSSIPGIQRVTIKPETGSVVLHYDVDRHDDFHRHLGRHCGQPPRPPATELDELAGKIEHEAEFLAQHSKSAKAIVHICKRLDHEIKVKTNNSVDLKIGLAAAVIGFTLLEVGASAATPIWLTLAVFSLNHFVELQERETMLAKMKAEPPPAAPVVVKKAQSAPSA